MGFEVQETFYLAKILLPKGTNDVSIGKVIAIGVKSKDQVEKFKDYTASEGESS